MKREETEYCADKLQAFTLVEVSIVLVIIGLLVGGVLVGQDLIKAAEMRAQISQIEKFDQAFLAFRLKYNCMAGDCAQAQSFGLGVPAGPGQNGGGNGMIYTQPWISGNLSTQNEHLNAWYHLSQAGLIEGGYRGWTAGNFLPDYTGFQPAMKIGQNGFVSVWTVGEALHPSVTDDDIAFGNSYYLAKIEPWPDLATQSQSNYAAAMTIFEIYSLDVKMDDGKPFAGKVRAAMAYSGPYILSILYGVSSYNLSGAGYPVAVKASW